MQLKNLVGVHELSGVDRETISAQSSYGSGYPYEDCQVLNFTLDGITYTACEDPEDGYRSSMRDLATSDKPTKNTFAPVKVVGQMKDGEPELLELRDYTTGKIVIEVGTDKSEDYYPCFVANFSPENMACNQGA